MDKVHELLCFIAAMGVREDKFWNKCNLDSQIAQKKAELAALTENSRMAEQAAREDQRADEQWEEYTEMVQRNKVIKKDMAYTLEKAHHYPGVLSHTITGCASDDIAHGDIDVAIQAEFGQGNGVMADSEFSQFWCYTSASMVGKVKSFVERNFNIILSSHRNIGDEITIYPLTNWYKCKDFLKKHDPYHPALTGEEHDESKDQKN